MWRLQSLRGRCGVRQMCGAAIATGGGQSLRGEEGLRRVQSVCGQVRGEENCLRRVQPLRRQKELRRLQSLCREEGLQPLWWMQSLCGRTTHADQRGSQSGL